MGGSVHCQSSGVLRDVADSQSPNSVQVPADGHVSSRGDGAVDGQRLGHPHIRAEARSALHVEHVGGYGVAEAEAPSSRQEEIPSGSLELQESVCFLVERDIIVVLLHEKTLVRGVGVGHEEGGAIVMVEDVSATGIIRENGNRGVFLLLGLVDMELCLWRCYAYAEGVIVGVVLGTEGYGRGDECRDKEYFLHNVYFFLTLILGFYCLPGWCCVEGRQFFHGSTQ